MKFLIQHTEDIYGTPLEIGVVQREKNETLRVPPFLWESLVYETGIAPFFSRMVRKISRRPETVSEQTVEGENPEEEKIIPGDAPESLFKKIIVAALGFLARLMYLCGVHMLPYPGQGFWMKDPKNIWCVVSDVSADTDFVCVLGTIVAVSWKKGCGKKVKKLNARIGGKENGIPCQVFTGEGQVGLALGRGYRETTVKDGTTVKIAPFLILALSAPAGVLPAMEKDHVAIPAGCRLWYIPEENMRRAIRIAEAKEKDSAVDTGNAYPAPTAART